MYVGRSSQTGTFNFTGIKRDASMAVLHAVVSGKCVLLLADRHLLLSACVLVCRCENVGARIRAANEH
jgi:hypothetical protein